MKIACKYTVSLIAVREVPDNATVEDIEAMGMQEGNALLDKIRAIELFDRVTPLDAQALDWDLYQSLVQASNALAEALNARHQAEGSEAPAANGAELLESDTDLPPDVIVLPGPSPVQ